jgi:hypothetical protein
MQFVDFFPVINSHNAKRKSIVIQTVTVTCPITVVCDCVRYKGGASKRGGVTKIRIVN